MSSTPDQAVPIDLVGYEVLVGVCGGIAAYKVCQVVSELAQRGAGVTVAMTEAGMRFVGPVTFQALSNRPVLTSLWAEHDAGEVTHIARTDAADLVLIAPVTANMIGKIAGGIADDLISTLVMSAASPVVLAPAMNERMWANPVVQRNVGVLKERDFVLVGPGEGWLACRDRGPGRMAEAREILDVVTALLRTRPPKAGAPAEQG